VDLKHLYTSIDGRIGRQQFWFGVIPLIVIGMAVSYFNPIAGFVVGIALIYFHVCVQGKRWHDRGKSAWWVLIGLIPIVGSIWVIVECGFLAGSPEPNDYGPAPTSGVVAASTTA
jgi:uncharacterized membrane protein YhaH (DUF805 family)